jgi:hypothetical protein
MFIVWYPGRPLGHKGQGKWAYACEAQRNVKKAICSFIFMAPNCIPMTKFILLHTEITVELRYPCKNTTHPSVNTRAGTHSLTHARTHTHIHLSKRQSLPIHDFPILRYVAVLIFKHFTESQYCPTWITINLHVPLYSATQPCPQSGCTEIPNHWTLQINQKLHGYS